MKKITLTLVALAALLSCEPKKSGNKDVLPAQDSTVVVEPTVTEDTVTVTENVLDENGNYVYNVGNLLDITLPDGTVLNVGENSTENKLFKFLSDNNFQVSSDKTQDWITLDRVYFSTGKSELTPTSQTQIDNIVALLKAYPNAAIKLGGYTDNAGSADINQPLSQKRAEAVMNAVVKAGINAERLSAEGYGQEHPICPANDTDECKAQNRRVDVRLIKK